MKKKEGGFLSIFRKFREKQVHGRHPDISDLEKQAKRHTPRTKDAVASWPESMNPDHGEAHEGDEIQEEVRKHRHGA